MDGEGTCVKESELKVGLSHLETDVNDLCVRVKDLAGKLSPVMRETVPSPMAETQVEKLFSPTGQHIQAIRDMVNETAGTVGDILKYLEV